MFEVELDIFSGRRNPSWFLTEQEDREVMARLRADPDQASQVTTDDEKFGLGYRGFIIRVAKHEDVWRMLQLSLPNQIPLEFRVGSKPAREGASIADWLLDTSARRFGLDDELRAVASRGVSLIPRTSHKGESSPTAGIAARLSQTAERQESETRGYSWYKPCPDPDYRDDRATYDSAEYLGKTNCYCFACSYAAGGRYAHPGAYGGKPAAHDRVDDIRGALYVDGWADNCQADSLTIAAAVWPDQDFHFYRLITGAPTWAWAHKQGATPTSTEDHSGVPLMGFLIDKNPANCDRGHYTDFVGWFYHDYDTAFCKEI